VQWRSVSTWALKPAPPAWDPPMRHPARRECQEEPENGLQSMSEMKGISQESNCRTSSGLADFVDDSRLCPTR
jgi:hypothetical protein